MDEVTFGDALILMQKGGLVRRSGWNGKGMFIFLVPGSHFVVNRAPLNVIFPEGTEIDYRSHVDMKTADGSIVPWVASQTDILATDWEAVAQGSQEIVDHEAAQLGAATPNKLGTSEADKVDG